MVDARPKCREQLQKHDASSESEIIKLDNKIMAARVIASVVGVAVAVLITKAGLAGHEHAGMFGGEVNESLVDNADYLKMLKESTYTAMAGGSAVLGINILVARSYIKDCQKRIEEVMNNSGFSQVVEPTTETL